MHGASKKPSLALLSGRIVKWFGKNARDLPWRRTRDPYAVWISEIMLQQTQVETVIPYYERWMRELPTVRALAEAAPERTLKLWEGLGYYRRVRHAHEAARRVMADFAGQFPRRFEDVLGLPGIGRYTAGAICSLAFNAPTPILDGNVTRVLCRVFGVEGNPREKQVNTRLWELAEELAQTAADHSALNQGLMELGALVCTPRRPRCETCPARGVCVARRTGRVEKLPMLGKRPAASKRRFTAFVVRRGERFLVVQRAAHVVNGSLWEFPNVEVADGRSCNASSSATPIFELLAYKPLFRVVHTITRYRILLEAFSARLRRPKPPERASWRTLDQLASLAFASAHRKILLHLRAEENQSRAVPVPGAGARRLESQRVSRNSSRSAKNSSATMCPTQLNAPQEQG